MNTSITIFLVRRKSFRRYICEVNVQDLSYSSHLRVVRVPNLELLLSGHRFVLYYTRVWNANAHCSYTTAVMTCLGCPSLSSPRFYTANWPTQTQGTIPPSHGHRVTLVLPSPPSVTPIQPWAQVIPFSQRPCNTRVTSMTNVAWWGEIQ